MTKPPVRKSTRAIFSSSELASLPTHEREFVVLQAYDSGGPLAWE